MANNIAAANGSSTDSKEKPKCGIIMPISSIDGLSETHWTEVYAILSDTLDAAGFEADLVSTAEEVGIIQKTIIQNLYENPIVVCDVSAKNPNVMFELGIRLAFDKPTIIVKDDKTSYTFDTAPIEHLSYPRDLRFNQIVNFKAKLAEKVKNTHKKASSDPNYTTFLKHFGEFTVAKIDQKEVSGQEFIIEEIKSLRQAISRLEVSSRRYAQDKIFQPPDTSGSFVDFAVDDTLTNDELDQVILEVSNSFPETKSHFLPILGVLRIMMPDKRSPRHLKSLVNSIGSKFPQLKFQQLRYGEPH